MEEMMKKLFISLAVLLTIASISLAVPAGRTLEFDKSPEGTVIFSGQIHKDAKVGCKDCHNKETFPAYKKGTAEINMTKIYAGELCGKCHKDGGRAFDAKTNCNRCHKK